MDRGRPMPTDRDGPTVDTVGLDAAFWTHYRLPIACLARLRRDPAISSEIQFFRGHPVMRVEVLGYVVFLERKSGRRMLQLDDGTGLLWCVQWLADDAEPAAAEPLQLGELVRVRGRLGEYREAAQLTVAHIAAVLDLDFEPLCWLQTMQLLRTAYARPGEAVQSAAGATAAGAAEPAVARKARAIATQPQQPQQHEAGFRRLVLHLLAGAAHDGLRFSELVASDELRAAAAAAGGDEASDMSLDERLKRLVRRTLMQVTGDGRVLVCEDAAHGGEARYRMLRGSSALGQFLCATAADERLHDRACDAGLTGISSAALVSLVQSAAGLSATPKAAILRCIDALVTQSELYEVREGVYRAL